MTTPAIPGRLPAGATQEGDGIMIGDGPVRIDAFIDFLCPFCRRFELSSGPALAGLLASGQVSLVYHPMNFLDQASTTRYSTRAAAASGCAADEGRFLEYAHALFVGPAAGRRSGPGQRGTRRHRPDSGLARRGVHRLPGRRALPGLAAVRDRRVPWRWESRRRPPSWSRAPPCARNRGPSRPRSKRRLALAEASRAGYRTASRSVVPFTSFTRSSRVPRPATQSRRSLPMGFTRRVVTPQSR